MIKKSLNQFLRVCRLVFTGRATGRERSMFFLPLGMGIIASFVFNIVWVVLLTLALSSLLELSFVILSERKYCLRAFCITLPNFALFYKTSSKEVLRVVRGQYNVTDAHFFYSAIFIAFLFKLIINIF